ncbi:Sodium-dependent phosphate transport protein 2B [Durusdinium trenchii]|uniref:Sodium-dependent phosphate transport protein 2B n=1 Tax=Durusdinium trenchii TaxID=1381693 RepID=A0ABP0SI51_9DINO
MTEAMSDALQRAEFRLMERAELGAAGETYGALSTIAASMAEASGGVAATAETAAVTLAGLEAETVLTASAVAAIAAFAARSAAAKRVAEWEDASEEDAHHVHLRQVWRAVLRQHPEAVLDANFLGTPFGYKQVKQRWPRLVQSLGITEDQALKIIEMDATPLLVESDSVSEVLARLAAISSREKALELVGRSPSLLVGGAMNQATSSKNLAASTLIDVLYAGRLYRVLEEEGRDNEGKLAEIELYAQLLSAFRPCVDLVLSGLTARDATDATRRIFRSLQDGAPNESIRVLLQRVADSDNPWTYLADQTRAGFHIGGRLAVRPALTKKILPHSQSIVTHLPSIYTRLSILGPHVPSIVRILDQYLDIVEPHLDRIMERMDRIEPHLPYILLHLDVLAKHCGALLDHFDLLMPYAELGRCLMLGRSWELSNSILHHTRQECLVDNLIDEWEGAAKVEENSYLPKLLPYVDFLVPNLDELATHLPLAHPHIPYVLPYMDDLLPHIKLFTRFPEVSKNADVLVGYLGWLLRVPLIPRILKVPLVPRFISWISGRLPCCSQCVWHIPLWLAASGYIMRVDALFVFSPTLRRRFIRGREGSN